MQTEYRNDETVMLDEAREWGYQTGVDAMQNGWPMPDLSGEWTETATPMRLLDTLRAPDHMLEELCEMWEAGAEAGYGNVV